MVIRAVPQSGLDPEAHAPETLIAWVAHLRAWSDEDTLRVHF